MLGNTKCYSLNSFSQLFNASEVGVQVQSAIAALFYDSFRILSALYPI
jgi:hypothetical protein